jgi:hypothetical protein
MERTELKPGIRWWRVFGGGLLIEVVLMAVAVPFFAAGRPDVVSMAIVPATLLAAAVCGAWAARGTGKPVLNGTLAGVAALVIYVLMAIAGMLAAPDQADLSTALSPAYLGSHVCKVMGGLLGGWWVARQRAGDAQAA